MLLQYRRDHSQQLFNYKNRYPQENICNGLFFSVKLQFQANILKKFCRKFLLTSGKTITVDKFICIEATSYKPESLQIIISYPVISEGLKYIFEITIFQNDSGQFPQITSPVVIYLLKVKACVRYFLSNFYFFHQMIALQKL